MKASKYNIILKEDDGGALIFNCVSCSCAKLSKENYECYLKITSENTSANGQEPDQSDIVNKLKSGSFILDESIDEIEMIKLGFNSRRFEPNQMTITILPTSVCNFKCVYCYEGELKPYYMTRDIEDRIAEFIDSSLGKGGKLKVTWFGGEPGLLLDCIYRLSEKIAEIVKRKSLQYSTLIVSNGYMLNKDAAIELRKRMVMSAQITIDGPRDVHNSRRPLKTGGGTYDTIMNNIKEVVDVIPVCIRVNLDKNNIDSLSELLDDLERNGLREKVMIELGNVDADTEACHSYKENIFNIRDYSERVVDLYELLLKRGFNCDVMPKRKEVNCSSIAVNGYFVCANGDIYKCESCYDMENECVGNINNPKDLESKIVKWLSWDPFSEKKCINCNVFPICRGGCPANWIIPSSFLAPEDRCTHWKYTLPQLMRLKYRYMKDRVPLNFIRLYENILIREANDEDVKI